MMKQNEATNLEYINNAAEQNQLAIVKQVTGDFQTLSGVAVCIGDGNLRDETLLRSLLERINHSNTFVRMGLATLEGKVDLLDLNGNVYRDVDLSKQDFFQQALQGKQVVSFTLPDEFGEGYVNYYATPVYRGGQITAVLCAVNNSDMFREIVDAPLFGGEGFTNIIDSRDGWSSAPPMRTRGPIPPPWSRWAPWTRSITAGQSRCWRRDRKG